MCRRTNGIREVSDLIRIGTLDWGPAERDAVTRLVSEPDPKLTLGKYVLQFERECAKWTGVKYGIMVNSGTSALMLALQAVKIKYKSVSADVITTSLTYMATHNAILVNGMNPVFTDIQANSLNMDLSRCQRSGVFLPVHLFGKPVQGLEELEDAVIVEDAAQAMGSELKGKKAGALGDIAVYSFFPAHQVCTIEGGMIVTNDKELSEICRALRDNSRVCTCQVCTLKSQGVCERRKQYKGEIRWATYDYPGYNVKPMEIQGLLGCLKMTKINEIVRRRHEILRAYNESLQCGMLREDPGEYICPLAYPIHTKNPQEVIIRLEKAGIETRGMYPSRGKNAPNAACASKNTLFLPAHQNLSDQEVEYIIENVKKNVEK